MENKIENGKMRLQLSLSTIEEESKSPSMSSVTSKTSRKRCKPSIIISSSRRSTRFDLPPYKHEASSTSEDVPPQHEVTEQVHPLNSTSEQEKLMCQVVSSRKSLFNTVVNEPTSQTQIPSIFVTRNSLRDVETLQEVLDTGTNIKLQQVAAIQAAQSKSSSSSTLNLSDNSASSWISELSPDKYVHTNTLEVEARLLLNKFSSYSGLNFLLGLPGAGESSKTELEDTFAGTEDEEVNAAITKTTKQAQTYLAVHQIFEFFQFIISHLLSAHPDNPIQFIIDLLESCLIYRAGLKSPPLLYDHNHLECLYNLMDRMRTGYIDLKQYKMGMHTLGICSPHLKLDITNDGLIRKEEFIENAYRNMICALDELLRIRWRKSPPTLAPSSCITPKTSSTRTSVRELTGSRFTKTRLFLDCI